MANPGTAYDDPNLGKDQRPGHMKDYVQTSSDNGGVHINSGIPNRAFVLAAKAIGRHSWEITGKIWYHTLTERLTGNADFPKCATETVSVARDLFPEDATIAEKVAKAWVEVGVLEETSPATALANVSAAYVLAPHLREVATAAALPVPRKKKASPRKGATRSSRSVPKKKPKRARPR